MPLLEICVDDALGLDTAIAGGADRIELCSSLALGGLTPSAGLMARAAASGVKVMAMVRPRSGDFVFAETEIAQMEAEIDAIRAAGLTGAVLGANLEDGSLDLPVLTRLCARAEGLEMTLHRAFDLVPDMEAALEQAVSLGFARILTSGGARSAIEGIEALRHVAARAKGRIGILPGGGVSAATAAQLLAIEGITELHASGSGPARPASAKAQSFGFDLGGRRETSGPVVAALRAAMDAAAREA